MADQTTEIAQRLQRLHAALDEEIAKRIPGDGDGDGIAYESRKPKGGGASGRGRAAAKPASFESVRNNPQGRKMIDAIEDTVSSLRGKKGDKVLGDALRSQIKALQSKFGYKYPAPDVLRDN